MLLGGRGKHDIRFLWKGKKYLRRARNALFLFIASFSGVWRIRFSVSIHIFYVNLMCFFWEIKMVFNFIFC